MGINLESILRILLRSYCIDPLKCGAYLIVGTYAGH